ncbi:MAG: TauD/TfdA family dioxygenase [Proteobacteria bacterium]|nr:TauD/TfdA family dioxygenase [Pseudomonadota bacterium]
MIDVRPLSGSIGAEIRGVDLAAELGQEAFAEIHAAFLAHQVVAFPDQRLTPQQQIAFARRFGRVMTDPFVKSPEDLPELMVVIKEKDEELAFGEGWHSDNSYLGKPPLGSFLYALEVPPVGGDTLFANQYLAYETLSPGLRRVLDGLKAVHNPRAYNKAIETDNFGAQRTMKLRNDAAMDAATRIVTEHPVVRTHPDTGRKALYVNSAYTVRFSGWTEDESRGLLEHLWRHAVRPEFTCRYRWRADTLLLWDNRCVMHHPINDYHGHRRVMHRVTAEGDRPI